YRFKTKLQTILYDPVVIVLVLIHRFLHFVIVHDPATAKVSHDHFTRGNPPFLQYVFWIYRQGAGFRCHNDPAIPGNAIAKGAKAVSVEGRADSFAIGKY